MTTPTIRQRLHSYLEVADDKKVKAIYAIMENDIKESALEYTEDIKSELDRRNESYKNGMAKMITRQESRKRVQAIVKASRKK